jgi:hypothetical protein
LAALNPPYAVLQNADYNEAKQGKPAPGQVLKDLPVGGLVAANIQACAMLYAVCISLFIGAHRIKLPQTSC